MTARARRADDAMAREAAGRMRTIAVLFFAGATIGLISLALPHSSRANTDALLSNIALAYAGAALAWVFARRAPAWFVHVLVVAGTLVVTRAIYYSGDQASYYAIWYAWVALYAFYFFSRPKAVLHLVVIAVAYAAVLAAGPGHAATARWLTTIFTLVIAAVFVDTLVRKLRRHASDSQENARRLEATAKAIDGMAACTDAGRLRDLVAAAAVAVTQANAALVWELSPDDKPVRLVVSRGDLRDAGDAAQLWRELRGGGGTRFRLGVLLDTAEPPAAGEFDHVLDVLAGAFSGASARLELMDRLEEAARTDELCGVPNRRAWEEELPRQLARARRFSYRLCVALLDLDGLKLLNDSLGHQAGDTALRDCASAWTSELRDVDTLVRWAGDEFALILPGSPLAEATEAVERIRATTPAAVTCSGGVVEWDGDESDLELVARADAALYEAKAAGRNRLVAHPLADGDQSRGSSTTTGISRVAIDR